MDRELTTGEKYIFAEVILAEVFYLLQLGVFLYHIWRWYQDSEAVRMKLKVPKKRDALLRHNWAIPLPSAFDNRTGKGQISDHKRRTDSHPLRQQASPFNTSQGKMGPSVLNRPLSGTRLNPPEIWFSNYNNQFADRNSERFKSLEQPEIAAMARMDDHGVGYELSVRRRKRNEPTGHSPD
ncbi:hypothetical protein TcWFU_010417 [Taenia crassiceps]|uniref:Uncharacterized protein n=1 Tax=Taenia crassiceps TaxID=6207 RepID=A0ABR4Q4S8_9CEST